MRHTILGFAVAMLAASGCSMAITAGADYTPDVNFNAYSSFTWDEPDARPIGDPRLENNPFFDERLHAAIEREFADRGIRPGAEGPALVIHHHATVREQVDVYELDRAAGYEMDQYGPGTQVIQYEVGTFLVDVADARTKDLIWRGWARLDVGEALADPATMERQINEAIGKMFEEFPVPIR